MFGTFTIQIANYLYNLQEAIQMLDDFVPMNIEKVVELDAKKNVSSEKWGFKRNLLITVPNILLHPIFQE